MMIPRQAIATDASCACDVPRCSTPSLHDNEQHHVGSVSIDIHENATPPPSALVPLPSPIEALHPFVPGVTSTKLCKYVKVHSVFDELCQRLEAHVRTSRKHRRGERREYIKAKVKTCVDAVFGTDQQVDDTSRADHEDDDNKDAPSLSFVDEFNQATRLPPRPTTAGECTSASVQTEQRMILACAASHVRSCHFCHDCSAHDVAKSLRPIVASLARDVFSSLDHHIGPLIESCDANSPIDAATSNNPPLQFTFEPELNRAFTSKNSSGTKVFSGACHALSRTKRAVIIGINYYMTTNRLHGCVNDAKSIAEALIKYHGFAADNIVLMADNAIVKRPTRANIIRELCRLMFKTTPGDLACVFYSGHGSQVACADGDEALNPFTPGMDDVICPCDCSAYEGQEGFIVDDELKSILVDNLPDGAQLRAVFDCCNSGTMLDLPYLFKDGDEFYNIIDVPPTTAKDALLLSGCRDDQESADGVINGKPSGALTWAFLKALQTSRSMPMTWKELHTAIRVTMTKHKLTQVPMLSVGNKYIINNRVDI